AAGKEINQKSNSEPNKETDPWRQREAQHQDEAKDDAEKWKHRTHRNTEWARPIRVGAPQDDDAEANKDESEERSNIREVSQRTDIDYGGNATDKHTRPDGCNVRCPKSRMNAGKVLREQTITRHRHKNAGLAQLEDKQDRGDTRERASADDGLRPGSTCKCGRDCRRIAKVSRIFSHPRNNGRHQYIKQRADDEARDDADRHVALRISCLLRRRGNSIESDESKKNNGGAAHDAADAARDKRMPIGGVNQKCSKRNHENDD